ncbi:uncharacterized protein LOC124989470 [Sciurus carolinensis]|uniref:uncharacterized protein LOC124989470 n=1 Tax=Sciurus carolinensis TaxID=30640 RepID=UPI001FB34FCB|nr:uncharacterized protein LOC124989470 [Sciurus carolinensis]
MAPARRAPTRAHTLAAAAARSPGPPGSPGQVHAELEDARGGRAGPSTPCRGGAAQARRLSAPVPAQSCGVGDGSEGSFSDSGPAWGERLQRNRAHRFRAAEGHPFSYKKWLPCIRASPGTATRRAVTALLLPELARLSLAFRSQLQGGNKLEWTQAVLFGGRSVLLRNMFGRSCRQILPVFRVDFTCAGRGWRSRRGGWGCPFPSVWLLLPHDQSQLGQRRRCPVPPLTGTGAAWTPPSRVTPTPPWCERCVDAVARARARALGPTLRRAPDLRPQAGHPSRSLQAEAPFSAQLLGLSSGGQSAGAGSGVCDARREGKGAERREVDNLVAPESSNVPSPGTADKRTCLGAPTRAEKAERLRCAEAPRGARSPCQGARPTLLMIWPPAAGGGGFRSEKGAYGRCPLQFLPGKHGPCRDQAQMLGSWKLPLLDAKSNAGPGILRTASSAAFPESGKGSPADSPLCLMRLVTLPGGLEIHSTLYPS